VDIDLLIAEPEDDAPLPERLESHAENARVEVETAIAMARRQDEVVEVANHRCDRPPRIGQLI
jgi:hypothetical protein